MRGVARVRWVEGVCGGELWWGYLIGVRGRVMGRRAEWKGCLWEGSEEEVCEGRGEVSVEGACSR
jgi:hypothetical protein